MGFGLGRYSRLSARCTPLIPSIRSDRGRESRFYSTSASTTTSQSNVYRDFIKCLPVHLAKKIFGYLDEHCLDVATRVSYVWEELGKQVSSLGRWGCSVVRLRHNLKEREVQKVFKLMVQKGFGKFLR